MQTINYDEFKAKQLVRPYMRKYLKKYSVEKNNKLDLIKFQDYLFKMYKNKELNESQTLYVAEDYLTFELYQDIRENIQAYKKRQDRKNELDNYLRLWFIFATGLVLFGIVFSIASFASYENFTDRKVILFFLISSNLPIAIFLLSNIVNKTLYRLSYSKTITTFVIPIIFGIATMSYRRYFPQLSFHKYRENDVIILISITMTFLLAVIFLNLLSLVTKMLKRHYEKKGEDD
ncbi:hypothetical protein DY130_03830 [Apilactobacillus micheneri]|uniref:Uncharacterized protein n=1 Tax=Apilactobacillus micheneri TaxID=1899430 RepID=A0A9Q8IP39_9LACO|nr:hypothetical protein DY121_03835 [Apilactobacillus micheneri]TPR41788.1 hypothetical protein DY123_04465 [Apilactobacillus micheneri]TPR44177.1 hypothetical protein DY130_03830 [Apilactobacillus micheneri]TPR45801.1 hypothetical protein DY128_03830 [Apilactobacillus micheneri]TPR51563.1 hypothetical protein DY126_03890 [Apilactobacillus micheneri]